MNQTNSQETYNQEFFNNGNLTHILKTEDLVSVSDRDIDQKQMLKKLKRRNKELKRQEEENKQQLLHAETIGMMIKYQFIYIKIENHIERVNDIVQERVTQYHHQFFSKLKNIMFQLKMDVIEQRRKQKIMKKHFINNMVHVITVKVNNTQSHFFTQIKTSPNINQSSNDNLLKKEQIEKQHKMFKMKNMEIKNIQFKNNQIMQKIQNKNTQFDLDKRQNSLQEKKMDQLLLNKIHQMETQNNQNNQKQLNMESQILSFVQEMNEILDSHERSTNVSQDQQTLQLSIPKCNLRTGNNSSNKIKKWN